MSLPVTIGSIVDERYEVLDVLGAGGSGTVYLAQHLLLKRRVALKVLTGSKLINPDQSTRFAREAKILSSLQHKNISLFYGYGLWNGHAYMAIEYVQGATLSQELDAYGALPLTRSLQLLHQIASAIGCAHGHGIIHRDLKPANIVITTQPDGTELVKVIDFGLANLQPGAIIPQQSITVAGTAIGTPLYMSPEQCAGKSPDHRADLYAIGCMMYEMIVGQAAFLADGDLTVMWRHLSYTPPPIKSMEHKPELVALLQKIIDKCLAKSVDERYQNADEFLADLQKAESNYKQYLSGPNKELHFASDSEVDENALGAATSSSYGNRSRGRRTLPALTLIAVATFALLALMFSPLGIATFADCMLRLSHNLNVPAKGNRAAFINWCINAASLSCDKRASDRLLLDLEKSFTANELDKDRIVSIAESVLKVENYKVDRRRTVEILELSCGLLRQLAEKASAEGAVVRGSQDLSDAYLRLMKVCPKNMRSSISPLQIEIARIEWRRGKGSNASDAYRKYLEAPVANDNGSRLEAMAGLLGSEAGLDIDELFPATLSEMRQTTVMTEPAFAKFSACLSAQSRRPLKNSKFEREILDTQDSLTRLRVRAKTPAEDMELAYLQALLYKMQSRLVRTIGTLCSAYADNKNKVLPESLLQSLRALDRQIIGTCYANGYPALGAQLQLSETRCLQQLLSPNAEASKANFGRIPDELSDSVDVAYSLMFSDAGIEHRIREIYNYILGRQPSSSELAATIESMRDGHDSADIAAAILTQTSSSVKESNLRAQMMWSMALKGASAPALLKQCQEDLRNGAEPYKVGQEITASPVYLEQWIRAYYPLILKRDAGSIDIASWLNGARVGWGCGLEYLLIGIALSHEVQDKYKDPRERVVFIYGVLAGRKPTAEQIDQFIHRTRMH